MSWLYATLLAPILVSMPVSDASDYLPNFDILGPHTGRKVDLWTSSSGVNPEELSEYIEGDIMLDPFTSSFNIKDLKNVSWPNGIVPYRFELVTIPPDNRSEPENLIRAALEEIQLNTCIKFKRHTDEPYYVRFTADKTGCWSHLGMVPGGTQALNLQFPHCFNNHTIFHELMHLLGFAHEHNRFDRDDYVKVDLGSILIGKDVHLNKMDKDMNIYGMGYDYDSVMHFSARAFSPSISVPIIYSLNDMIKIAALGHMDGLSAGDILKIKARYNCTRC